MVDEERIELPTRTMWMFCSHHWATRPFWNLVAIQNLNLLFPLSQRHRKSQVETSKGESHPTETWLYKYHQASQAISSWQGCFIWTFPLGIISDTDFRINGAAQFIVCYQGTNIMHRSATFLWCIYQVHNPHYPIYRSSWQVPDNQTSELPT